MIKNLILSALLSAGIFGASGASITHTFSYASQPCNLKGLGANQVGSIGVAMRFLPSNYVGMQVTHIDAYLNADESTLENISATQLFMSTELPSSPGRENILSAPVTPTMGEWSGEKTAVLSYDLDVPYIVTTDPIFVGYYLNVNKIVGNGERYPALLDSDVKDPNATYFISSSANNSAWGNDSYTVGAAIIVLTLTEETYTNGVGVFNSGTAYIEADKESNVLLYVANGGNSSVNTISYYYTIDGGEPINKTLTLEEPLPAHSSTTFEVLFPIDPVEMVGNHTMELTVTEVNGQPNEAEMATATVELDVFPYFPKHRPLVEEFTSLYCSYCPRGYVAMEYVSETYPDDAVVICYHIPFQNFRDPMTVASGTTVDVSAYGYPSATIERSNVVDPYYGYGYFEMISQRDLGIIDDIFSKAAQVPLADIEVADAEVVAADNVINVKTNVTFMKEVADDSYRIGYVLTGNGLYDPKWIQFNAYYLDKNIKDAPVLQQCYSWESNKTGLIFNDVAVDVTALNGIRNSLVDVEINTPVVNEYTFNVSDVKNIYGQSLNPYIALDKLVINAFVIDKATGEIVNACKFPVSNVYDAVEGIEAEGEVESISYFDLTGMPVVNPEKGIFIKSEKFSSGGVRNTKVVL